MIVDPKWVRYASIMSSAVTVKGLLIFGGYWVGEYADKRWGTAPWFMFLGVIAGTTLGFIWLLHVAKRERPPS
ncbi:MAG: AtpZ/AtpI family protein [Bdellovibrionaceae bacterium]|nr:AtpZ/AtpI family protein [Bdellovibrionales bacterium]MCB9253375.1 AtpZ/AtpI family protein [Pseudobdellovibrionaceae bacterium]